MKYLCAILALLVLTLSAQPVCIAAAASTPDCCADSHCAGEEQEDEAGEDKKACEQCNPFQLCGCCAFSVVPVAQLSIRPAEKPVSPGCCWGIQACPAVEAPVLGFWQPPKIAV